MAIIYSYPLISELASGDTIAISDASNGNKTKSVTIGQLDSYINTGQATVTQVDDRVVTGASFNTNDGVLTLTRNSGGIPSVTTDLDGRYALTSSLATVATTGAYSDLTGQPTIPTNNNELTNGAGYTTNLGIVQSLTTTGSSGAATLISGVLNIPQYSGGGGSGDTYDLNAGTKSGNSVPLNLTSGSGGDNSVVNLTGGSNITLTQTSATEITIDSPSTTGSELYKRTFTGSELVDAFNGNLSDKIVLVSVPAGKIALVENALFIIKAGSTGTTNYNANSTLYVLPQGAISVWGPQLPTSALNASVDYVFWSEDSGSGSSLTQYGGVGADIILGPPSSGGGAVNISQGDREVIVSVAYRIVDF